MCPREGIGRGMPTAHLDAVQLLVKDHRTVEALFARFEKLGDGKASQNQKRKVVDLIVRELVAHAAIEETVLYPAARKLVHSTEDQVLEALEEHHVVKWMLNELEKMKPDHERFDAKVTVLMEAVRHHVEEEERELFPKLKKSLPKAQLVELGAKLVAAKKRAPTRPHPMAPDTPPGNLIASAGAAMVDRVRDAGRRLVARAADGVGARAASTRAAKVANAAKTTMASRIAKTARTAKAANGAPARHGSRRSRTSSGTHRVHRAA